MKTLTERLTERSRAWPLSRRLALLRRLRLRHYQTDPSLLLADAGLPPDSWQTNLLRTSHQETLLLCPRQAGKTTVAAALALREALLTPDSLVLLLAPAGRQSKELLQAKLYPLYDALGQPVPPRKRLELSLELANGSRIIALPDNPEGIVGYSGARLLVIDEAALVPDELYQIVRPMLLTSRGSILALSTPYGQRGWFHTAWQKETGWHRVRASAEACPRFDKERLARERMRVGPRRYRQDYELEFLDAVDQLFAQDVIDAATTTGYQPLF